MTNSSHLPLHFPTKVSGVLQLPSDFKYEDFGLHPRRLDCNQQHLQKDLHGGVQRMRAVAEERYPDNWRHRFSIRFYLRRLAEDSLKQDLFAVFEKSWPRS